MAKSMARKRREAVIRSGRRDPAESRLAWTLSPITKRTPTREERRRRMENKYNDFIDSL